LGDPIDGTTEWLALWHDLVTPAEADFFELRCTAGPPASGTAYAWFDDLKFIEWEPWRPLAAAAELSAPNNYRFVQIRCPDSAATTATVSYLETAYGPVSTANPGHTPSVGRVALRNFPNPFNPRTTIELTLPSGNGSLPVEVTVFDLRGRHIVRLFHGQLEAGRRHGITWDGRDENGRFVPSGVYFARSVVAERMTNTTKMVLVR
jgi:hypothetical protein